MSWAFCQRVIRRVADLPAQLCRPGAGPPDRRAVVPAEISDGPVIGASGASLPGGHILSGVRPAAHSGRRLDTTRVHVATDAALRQDTKGGAGPARLSRCRRGAPGVGKIRRIAPGVAYLPRAPPADPVFQPLREQRQLRAIGPLGTAPAFPPP